MEEVILIKYGEIFLKGDNRPFFESALIKNIKIALPGIAVERTQGRYFLRGFDNAGAALERLSKVFGIHAMSLAYVIEKDIDVISEFAIELMRARARPGESFKVAAKRSDKTFPMESPQIAGRVGGDIFNAVDGIKVDVKHPNIILNVEIREKAYIYLDSAKGAGGMPVGTGGRAMLLLSGGIDSPVAGWMMAKRGVQIEAVHFYSFPYTSERAKQKVLDLAGIMAGYCGKIKVHVVNFTKIQEQIHRYCPPAQLTIIMRRFMMKIAERIALKRNAGALVTGESLGQVASQTIDSLRVTDECAHIPVFRPLIGFDKLEIIEISKKIGAYETSILPYEDCCTVFTPRHPVTHPKSENIVLGESALDIEALIGEALENTDVYVMGE